MTTVVFSFKATKLTRVCTWFELAWSMWIQCLVAEMDSDECMVRVRGRQISLLIIILEVHTHWILGLMKLIMLIGNS